jgi:hypothetical protein
MFEKLSFSHGRNEEYIQNYGRKSEGKRPLVRARCRWEGNIRERADWMHVTQDRYQWRVLVNTVMNLGFSRMTVHCSYLSLNRLTAGDIHRNIKQSKC